MTFTQAKNEIQDLVKAGNADNNLSWEISQKDLTESDKEELTKDWDGFGEGMYVKEFNGIEYMIKIILE